MVTALAQLGIAMGLLGVYFGAAEEEVRRSHARVSSAMNRALSGHIEVCSGCHSVHPPSGEWMRLEKYVAVRTGSLFSHGICPACMAEHYGDMMDEDASE